MSSVAIVDYGVGNIRSLLNAFVHIGIEANLISDPVELQQVQRIVLPGVGAVTEAMDKLDETGLGAVVTEMAGKGTPVIGVCLGMQLLCNRSDENGGRDCLGLIDAEVTRFASKPDLKVPHIGWNGLEFRKDDQLLKDVVDDVDVYFVHSYFVSCNDKADILTATDYDISFASMISRGNIYGAQFHPEKSQTAGLQLLKNFSEL